MKKADLKNRMVVKTRKGNVYMVVDDHIARKEGFVFLKDFDDDLYSRFGNHNDIIEVYDRCSTLDIDTFVKNNDPIWKREEETLEVTMADVEEKFGCKVKIVKDKEEKETIKPWSPFATNCCCNCDD